MAEDAVQDTFLKPGNRGFRGESSEKTWLTRIAINTCKSYLRSPWLKRRADSALLENLTVDPTGQMDDTLPRAILSLPNKSREIICYTTIKALSFVKFPKSFTFQRDAADRPAFPCPRTVKAVAKGVVL